MTTKMTPDTPRFVYNPTKKAKFVRDLNIKVNPGKVVDLFTYNKNQGPARAKSLEQGDLARLLASRELIVVPEPKKIEAPTYSVSTKPVRFKVYCMKGGGNDELGSFIEAAQQEWVVDNVSASENQVAKNTETLINSESMDNFDDPSDRKW